MEKQMVVFLFLISSYSYGMEIEKQNGLSKQEFQSRLTHIVSRGTRVIDHAHNNDRVSFDVKKSVIKKVAHQISADLVRQTNNINDIAQAVLNAGKTAEGGYRYALVCTLLKEMSLSRVEYVKFAYDLILSERNILYTVPLCTEIVAKIEQSVKDDSSADSYEIALVFNEEKNVSNEFLIRCLSSKPGFKVVMECATQDLSLKDLIYLGQIYLLLASDYGCACDTYVVAQSHDPLESKKIAHSKIEEYRDCLMIKLERIGFPHNLKKEQRVLIALCLGGLVMPGNNKKDKFDFGISCLKMFEKEV